MKKLNVFKLVLTISVILLLLVTMTSCGSGSISSIARKYAKETMSFNFDEAKKYVSKDKIALYDDAKKKYSTEQAIDFTRGLVLILEDARFTVADKKISEDGTAAEVTVRISKTNSTFNDRVVSLVKENGKWKVNNENIDLILFGR